MKAFISSVRRGLQAERDYLPDLITAIGHTPSRFEDFGAINATGRGACLDGVNQADVYLLLLGPHYGDEMADSGISATEEEFNVAQQRGMPVLVFKKIGVDHDPEQQQFMNRVGNYQEGRFWGEFTDPQSLGVLVAKALTDLAQPAPPLTFQPLTETPVVPWRTDHRALSDRHGDNPILEAHVLPIGPKTLLPVAQLGDLANRIAAQGRHTGFFGAGDPLTIESDAQRAWVIRPAQGRGGRYGWPGSDTSDAPNDGLAGIAVGRDGSATIFQFLPTDTMGALVNQADLQQRLKVLLRNLTPHLPGSEAVTFAAAIDPLDRVAEGDPVQVGNRTSGHMPFNRVSAARAEPVDQVTRASVPTAIPEIANELAVCLLHAMRGQSNR